MSALPVPVAVDPETGIRSVDGQAMLLVPRHFWVFMQMECERRFGVGATRAVCYMFASAFTGAMEYVAEAAGQPMALEAEETQCGAEGAQCCRFEVRPRR